MNILGFFRPGFWEIAVIVLVALALFGTAKLPAIGRALGDAIRGFRSSVKEENDDKGGDDTAHMP